MKNILNNKYKLFTVLAAVTILFASCSNGTQTKNSGMPEGKALVSFKVQIPENIPENSSRAVEDVQKIASDPIGWDDIQKIVLKIEKYNAENQLVSYYDDFEWETSVAADTGIKTTAYDKMQAADPVELEFGIYAFDAKMYLDTQEEEQCYWACTYESHINSSTETITLNAAPAGTGDLTVNFSLNFSPNASEDCYPSLKAGLYYNAGCTTPKIDLTEIDSEGNFNVSVSEGTYYLKYVYYMNIYKEYDYDLQQSVYDEIPLNTVGPIPVYINAKGAQATIEIEEDDFNTLPGQKGTFIFDSTLIDIVSEPIADDFYLNNGTVIFRVKDHDTKEFINLDNVSVELYYGSQMVESSYYTLSDEESGTDGEPDFDYVIKFNLNEDKPLLTGGKYQLSIIATKPAGAAVDTSVPFFYSARTIDLTVKPQVYFEFDVTNKTASELGMAMSEKLKALRNDASIKIYGTPKDVESMEINGTTYNKAKNYISYIASVLGYGIKNNLVDLDISQMKLVYELKYGNGFQSCDSLRSIKLPPSLHEISMFGLTGCQNLQTIEFTIDDNDYGVYDIQFQGNPFDALPSLEQFIITNPKNKQTNCFTLDDGKVLLSMMTQTTARIILVASEADEIALPLNSDISVTRIEGNTFSYSRASVITGLDNVTTLADQAFKDYQGGASINLPNVETIGDYIFQGAELNALTGLSKVTQIGNYAFKEAKITTLTGLSNVTSVGSAAFDSAEIQTLDFGPKLSVINGSAFKDSKVETLGTNVTGITSIGDSAFEGSHITAIPDLSKITSSTDLGIKAFKNCWYIQEITIDQDFLDFISSSVVNNDSENGTFVGCNVQNLIIDVDLAPEYGKVGEATSATYNNGWDTKRTAINMFKVENKLTFNKTVTLPDLSTELNVFGMGSINDQFFNKSLSSLQAVEFKAKSIIGIRQFTKCEKLASITFNDASNQSEIRQEAFWINPSKEQNTSAGPELSSEVQRPVSNIVLTGVRKIGYQAINKVTEAGTLTIPESLIAIQGGAFSGIESLTTFDFAATSVWARVQSTDKTNFYQNGEAEQQIDVLLSENTTITASTNPSETGESPNYYYTVYADITQEIAANDTTGAKKLLPLAQEIVTDYGHAWSWYYRSASN